MKAVDIDEEGRSIVARLHTIEAKTSNLYIDRLSSYANILPKLSFKDLITDINIHILITVSLAII